MDLSTRPISVLVAKIFSRNRVAAEGYFHLGIVSDAGIALLTRTNSSVARRIRVKSYSNLKRASAGKRIKLVNNQTADLSIVLSEHIYGDASIKITWIQDCRRFETELKVHTLGIY